MIENVFSQRELHVRKLYVDMQDNSWVIVILGRWPRKSEPIRIIWGTYYTVFFSARGTWNSANKRLRILQSQ